MPKQKILLLVLTLLLVGLVTISGCGGGVEQPATPSEPAGPEEPQEPAEPEEPQAPAEPQDWQPDRPIDIYVGFDPGGGLDVTTRAAAPHLSEFLGVNVNVVNMPGAQGAIAVEHVLSQPADGYTWTVYATNVCAYPASGVSDVTPRDIIHLGFVNAPTCVISVPYDSPFEDITDLIEAIKEGGTLAGNSGLMGAWHIPQAYLVHVLGGEVEYVPYEGGAPTALATARGEVDWSAHAETEGMEYWREGHTRPLAAFSREPLILEGIGEIPPITDYVDMDVEVVDVARGWALRADTPDHIVQKCRKAVEYLAGQEEWLKWLEDNHLRPLAVFGDDAQELIWEATKIQSWLMYDVGAAERSPEEVGVPRP